MRRDTCSIPDCENEALARSWCGTHYQRWRVHGDPLKARPKAKLDGDRLAICRIDGCENPAHAMNLCNGHYLRSRRNGHPLAGRPPQTKRGTPRRAFEELAALETDECVVWPYGKSGGYGMIRHEGRPTQVHRLALLRRTPLPFEGAVACHAPQICHNRACMNYRHLRWATQVENVADKKVDGTANVKWRNPKTHCKRGHEFDEANTAIAKDGSRVCRACARLKQAAARKKRRRAVPD